MTSQQYGKWTIEEPLSEGGQALTFLVYETTDPEKKLFVLKRLKNPNRLNRFEQEIKAGLELSHPNILKVVDKDLEHARPYFVSEYCHGGNLNPEHQSRLTIIERLKMFSTICRAIGYAHANGVIHRDIKPDNIFLREDHITPVVGDFGLCFIEDGERVTMTEEVVGSRWYTAPELAHGVAEEVTQAADIYSLGKVLYWMLAGRIFDREMHRTPRFDLTKDQVAPDYFLLYEIFNKTIVDDPSKRLSDANEVADVVDDTIRRIEMHAHHIDPSTPQRCMYCGIGFYQVALDASRETKGHHLTSSIQNFGFYGGINDPVWLIMACDHCGNVQIFRPDYAKNHDVWKKR